jgi:hypothetical protein
VTYQTFSRFNSIAYMVINLTPPPHERWTTLPRQGLYNRPPEVLRGLSAHVLLGLARAGHINIITVNRPNSTRPIRLVDLKSLDDYLDRLAAKREFWHGVPRPEQEVVK